MRGSLASAPRRPPLDAVDHHQPKLNLDGQLAVVPRSEVRRIVLTASGGPFLNHSPDELAQVTVADALKHPTWKMGPKITVDSSTLMNKGLEVIEAHWLFGVDPERIERIVNGIVRRLESSGESDIKSQHIGELVMDALGGLDPVAYVRFASVYRNFREARDFETFIEQIGSDEGA